MSNVVAFEPGCIPGEPDPEIIGTLERLLEQARSGHLTGVAYVSVALDGAQGTGWVGGPGTRHPLGSAIMMLQHRYVAALMEGGA